MDEASKKLILDKLAGDYAIRVLNSGGWAAIELEHLLGGVEDLATMMGGAGRFRGEVRWVLVSRLPLRTWAAAMALPLVDVVYFRGASWSDPPALRWQTVHELAHIWDMRSFFGLSRGLKKATGGKYVRFRSRLSIRFEYEPGGRWLKGREAPLNALEDWADSVATYVYADYAESLPRNRQGPKLISPVRWSYVRHHMQARLTYPLHWIPHFYGPEGLGPAPV